MMLASDCVLIHADAFHRNHVNWNATAARATTGSGLPIKLYLSCPARPMLPTILFVSAPGVDFTNNPPPPHIVRAVEDLMLLRVPDGRSEDEDEYDYFIYRPGGPSLKLLPRPLRPFLDQHVGLLRHGEEHYTVAALLPSRKDCVYDLHRFDSATDKWSIDEAPLVEPQISFPYKNIPRKAQRLLFHLTSTVIPIGGEGGTMGWVDLWRGILLCDVLSREPKLRGVPLPLPLEHLSCNNGLGTHLGCPKSIRGITAIAKPGMEPCLKFVHLGVTAVPIPDDPYDDSYEEDWEMHDWTITTWSNNKMTTSWKDWHMDCEVKASRTTISSKLKSKMLKSGLLSPGGKEPEQAFQNLLVTFPAPGIDDDVVYLQARLKFRDPKVFVLALDTRDNKLLGAVQFATERIPYAEVVYFPSNIGKYIDPGSRCFPIPKDDPNWEESSQYEGTERRVKTALQKLVLRRQLLGPSLKARA